MTGPGFALTPRLDAQVRSIVADETADIRVLLALLQEQLACIEGADALAAASASAKPSQQTPCCGEQVEALDTDAEQTAGCFQVATDDGVHDAPNAEKMPQAVDLDDTARALNLKGKDELSEDSKGSLEKNGDHWEFEEDSFTVGTLAIAKRGLRGAWAPLVLALLTPLLQLVCFFAVFSFMIVEKIEVQFDGMRLLASVTCFFLMGLQLTNEMLEGFHKMVFSWRCFSGMYKGVCQKSCIIGVALGFFQLSMPCWIVGLSMQLVLGADTVLDAFMNYVALIFITEIDNTLIGNRIVRKLFFCTGCDIHVEYAVDKSVAASEASTERWTFGMTVFSVLWIFFCQGLGIVCQVIADTERDHVTNPRWWFQQLPAYAGLLVILHLAMGLGSLRFQVQNVASVMAVIGFLFCFTIYLLHLRGVINLVQPLATMTIFTFGILAVPLGTAKIADPFSVLHCPVRLPSLCWLILIACTTWTWHFDTFKYA